MTGQPEASEPRRHLIIAGTGRSGTTFLVRYLTALGLDTHLSRRGESAWLDEQAQAGLEDFPLGPDASDLPYVIKNPMLYEFVDQVIASDSMRIDGVIIPVRNLREAASSRLILERRSMYEHLPWLGFMDKAWESSGNVPGGLIFSLNALDEARTLSMGLHLLVERLVHANIPMVFVDFPRIVTDAGYLYEKLAPFLPASATEEAARAAHVALAEPQKVRIEREMGGASDSPSEGGGLDEQLDRIALLRELVRLRTANRDLQAARALETNAEIIQLREQLKNLERQHWRASDDLMELRADFKKREAAYNDLERQHEKLKEYFALASEQLEELAQRPVVAWLKPSDSETRKRIVAAERDVYEVLVGYADEVASIADKPKAQLGVTEFRARFAIVLDQLETANDELAILSERLARREANPIQQLRKLIRATLRSVRTRSAAP